MTVGLALNLVFNLGGRPDLLWTGMPEVDPTATEEPTDEPTGEPADTPVEDPTDTPSQAPTDLPTEEPPGEPTDLPSDSPSEEPAVCLDGEVLGLDGTCAPAIECPEGEYPDAAGGCAPLAEDVIEGMVAEVIVESQDFDVHVDLGVNPEQPTSEAFIVSDEEWHEVDPDLLQQAEVGDHVAAQTDEAGGLEDLQVLASAAAPAVAAAAAAASHTVDVVILTPPGVAIGAAAMSDVQSSLALISQYWGQQTGGAVTFGIGKAIKAEGRLPSCSTGYSEIWNLAKELAGTKNSDYLDSTVTVGGAKVLQQTSRHLLTVLPAGTCKAQWNGTLGIGTVGSGIKSGGFAMSFYSTSGTAGNDVIAHELGHNLGFKHSGAIICTGAVGTWDPLLNDTLPAASKCTVNQYHDWMDVMGYAGKTSPTCKDCFGSLSAIQKIRAGINLGIKDVPSGSPKVQITLSAVSLGSGQRAVTATDATTGEQYVFELRAVNGYDSSFGTGCNSLASTSQTHGVRVMKLVSNPLDTSSSNNVNGTAMLLLNPAEPYAMPAGSLCKTNQRATSFGVGQTFTSSTGNIVMKVDAISGTSATITVSNAKGSGAPVTISPTVNTAKILGDGIGLRTGNAFRLSSDPASGRFEFSFTFGRSNDDVYVGDWNGNGVDTLGLRRGNIFYLSNDFKGGTAEISYSYGRVGDQVYVGDWNGNGIDTFAVRRGNQFYLMNSVKGGVADTVFSFGKATDEVFVGDWNGDGKDTFGVRRGATIYLSNSFVSGPAAQNFDFGIGTDTILVGDWNRDGRDTLGLRRGRQFMLTNSLQTRQIDYQFSLGTSTDLVVVGTWK